MIINIEHNVGDKFFYLKQGNIYPAIITEINVVDRIYNFNKFIDGDTTQKEKIVSYLIKYQENRNGEFYWQGSSTLDSKIFYKTKQDAAKAFLLKVGLEPSLGEIS